MRFLIWDIIPNVFNNVKTTEKSVIFIQGNGVSLLSPITKLWVLNSEINKSNDPILLQGIIK